MRDLPRVATEAGNSPAIVQRHYAELVKPDATKKFFAILPREAENVIRLSAWVAHGMRGAEIIMFVASLIERFGIVASSPSLEALAAYPEKLKGLLAGELRSALVKVAGLPGCHWRRGFVFQKWSDSLTECCKHLWEVG
jgi:hypothetical protein